MCFTFFRLNYIEARNYLQVPQYSMLVFASISSVIAIFFNIETIVDMLSIGTLMAYMAVTCGLIMHRFAGTVHQVDDIFICIPVKTSCSFQVPFPEVLHEDASTLRCKFSKISVV